MLEKLNQNLTKILNISVKYGIVILLTLLYIPQSSTDQTILRKIYLDIVWFLIPLLLFFNIINFFQSKKKHKLKKLTLKEIILFVAKGIVRIKPIRKINETCNTKTRLIAFQKLMEIIDLFLRLVYAERNNSNYLQYQLNIFNWTTLLKILNYKNTWAILKKIEYITELLTLIFKNILLKLKLKNKDVKIILKILLFYLSSFNFIIIVIPSLVNIKNFTKFELIVTLAKTILWVDRLNSLGNTINKIYNNEESS